MTQLSDDDPPDYLFKYRYMRDEQQREWLRQTLLENRFYWPSPSEFNDPFDCAPCMKLPSRKAMAKSVRRVVRNSQTPMNRSQRKKEERRLRLQPRAVLSERLRSDIPQLIDETAVYSLTRLPDNVLMWSHYASSHEGVCLRFVTDMLLNKFILGWPITYSQDRPVVSVANEEPMDLLTKSMLMKADYWSYEKEWRFIEYRGGRGLRNFPPAAMDGVVLGARISAENEALVREWVGARTSTTELLRARFDDRAFRLDIVSAGD